MMHSGYLAPKPRWMARSAEGFIQFRPPTMSHPEQLEAKAVV